MIIVVMGIYYLSAYNSNYWCIFLGSGYSTRSGLLVLNASLFNHLGYSPGLFEIVSHSELIPDVDLILTVTRKKYNESIKKVTPSSFEPKT